MARIGYGTALASAARTATAHSGDLLNADASGILVTLDVTAASGTGGLTVAIEHKDPASSNYVTLNGTVTAVTATGTTTYLIAPGATGGGVTLATAGGLPAGTFRITVTAGDTSSYTYSVGYALIN